MTPGRRQARRLRPAGRAAAGERAGDLRQVLVGRAVLRRAVRDHGGMTVVGLGDDVGAESLDVIRAQQPEVLGAGEGHVEQRLVALALDELVGGAVGPDRLADTPQPAAAVGVGVDELAPGGDDPRRVVPTSAMSAKVTSSASGPSSSRSRAIRAALTTTRAGSCAATASRSHGSVPSTKPSSPRVQQGLVAESCRRPGLEAFCRCRHFRSPEARRPRQRAGW